MKVMESSVYGEERRRDRITDSVIRTSIIGQAVAAVLAVGLVLTAVIFFFRGDTVAGGLLLSIPTVLLVRTFWSRTSGGGDSPED